MLTLIIRVSLALAGLTLLGLFLVRVFSSKTPDSHPERKPPPTNRQASLIESIGLPEFAAWTNAEKTTPAERAIAEEMMPAFQLVGDGKNFEHTKKAIAALSKIVTAHPAYPDVYFLRATLAISVGDLNYENMLSDISSAIRLHSFGQFASAYDSASEMYALRAKVHMLAGHYPAAMNDLEKAVTINPGGASQVFNTGGVKPEDQSNPTAIQKADCDALIAKCPDNYRVYMFRGLFYRFFTTFGEQYYRLAFDDLNRASRLNPKSALVKYFLGSTTQHMTFLTEAAARDISDMTGAQGGFKERTTSVALRYFREATELQPTFADAHASVAECLSHLKRYSEAIRYYDKAIELDPKNAAVINDRGLAKTSTNDYNGAVRDFSTALELKTSKGTPAMGEWASTSYENRAAVHMKIGNYDAAIADYGMAIGLHLKSLVLLMSLPQIRAIYPEFNHIVDADLIEGLRQKYFPNMSPADYAENYAKKTEPYNEFVVAELYQKRGDALLARGQFKKAVGEYSRSARACNGWPLERWRTFSRREDTELFIDTETLRATDGKQASIWLKEVNLKSSAYNQQNYECDCVGRRLRSLATMTYDAHGNLRNSFGEQQWQPIAPDTIGEILYRGLCQ